MSKNLSWVSVKIEYHVHRRLLAPSKLSVENFNALAIVCLVAIKMSVMRTFSLLVICVFISLCKDAQVFAQVNAEDRIDQIL